MSPSPSRRRYRFGPREQRGVLLGLRAGQLAVLVGAALAGLLAARLAPAGLGLVAGLLVLAVIVPVAFAPVAGHTLEQWAPVAVRFAARAVTGRLAYRSPTPEAGTWFPTKEDP